MSDIITKIHINESINHGGIVIQSPKGLGSAAITGVDSSDYTITTYSTDLPTTGTVFTKYKDRFDDYQFYSS